MARGQANLKKQANEILRRAKEKGVDHSFWFVTTFTRYQTHIAHLEELEKAIQENGAMVTKEYVKGRQNLYVNPAVTAYNQTSAAADKTAQLLMKYIVGPLNNDGESSDDFDQF